MFSPNVNILSKQRQSISTYNIDERNEYNDIKLSQNDINENESDNNDINQLLVDVLENDKSLTIICPMPGISLSDISITLDDDTLSISGECVPPLSENNENISYLIKEVNWGTYRRDIILPHNVQKTNIKARFVNGILIIDIPKQPKIKSKNIKIEVIK